MPEIPRQAIDLILEHGVVQDCLARSPGSRRWVESQVRHYLQFPLQRCTFLREAPCARYPACLCGNQVLENLLLDLDGTVKNPSEGQRPPRLAHSGPPRPPAPSDPGEPPRAPAMAMPVPQEPVKTDAVAKRSLHWRGERR